MEGNKKRTLAEIDAEIKATKEALNNVHGNRSLCENRRLLPCRTQLE